jgi:hypothetical protein
MRKGETIDVCLKRIALSEVGCTIDPAHKEFVNQTVGRFRSQQGRQDLSTCYAFRLDGKDIHLNATHLTQWMFINDLRSVPQALGGVYRDHLNHYFESSSD